MNITELQAALEAIKEKEGDLPIYIPFNDNKDDFKKCQSISSQMLYFGLFGSVEEKSVVLRHGKISDAD